MCTCIYIIFSCLFVFFTDVSTQGYDIDLEFCFRYEPPNTCIVFHESDEILKAPLDFQLVGHIKKHKSVDSISLWMPQPPSGFVSLGCIACKGTPKQSDFTSLRCIRNDMVTGAQFSDESIWDTSEIKFMKYPFSIWVVGNDLGPFVVRSGFKKPPKRFALKLADQDIPSGSDNMLIDAEIRTFSVALFDDYGGLVICFLHHYLFIYFITAAEFTYLILLTAHLVCKIDKE